MRKRSQIRHIDRMYRDGITDMLKGALKTLKSAARFLGRNLLRLTIIINRAGQVLLTLNAITAPVSLIAAKKALEQGQAAAGTFSTILNHAAIMHATANYGKELPSGLRAVLKTAINIIMTAIGIGLNQLTIIAARLGVEYLS